MNKGQRRYVFRGNDGRTGLVQLLAALAGLGYAAGWLWLGGSALLGLLGWLELSAEGVRRLVDLMALAGWAQMVLFVCSGLVFLAWLYRAACNARALGAVGMQVSPAWAVGGFFVPCIQLFLPYQAMREIRANGALDSEPEGWLLRIWWFGLLGGMGLDRFGSMQEWEAQADGVSWLLLITLSSWLLAGSAYALLRLVGEINARQNALAAEQGLG